MDSELVQRLIANLESKKGAIVLRNELSPGTPYPGDFIMIPRTGYCLQVSSTWGNDGRDRADLEQGTVGIWRVNGDDATLKFTAAEFTWKGLIFLTRPQTQNIAIQGYSTS